MQLSNVRKHKKLFLFKKNSLETENKARAKRKAW